MSMAEAAPGCKRLCGLVALMTAALSGTGCPHARPMPAPALAQPPPATQVALQQGLLDAVKPLSTAGASVGLVVLDAPSGNVLASQRPTDLFTPASTVKVVTTAALLHHLDPALRFTTTLQSSTPTPDGTVPSDLFLVGGGDPSLGSARFLPDTNPNEPAPWDLFSDVAAALRRSGVTRVQGAVVGDARVLQGCSLAPGWAWDDAPFGYSAVPCGLTLHEGLTWLRALSLEGGMQAVLTPPTSQVRVTLERGPLDGRGLDLFPDGERVRAAWRGPDPLVAASEPISVPNPARYAAEQLLRSLTAQGITVERGHRTAIPTDVAPTATTWMTVQSPTLRQLCQATNQQSLNLYAEMLLMQLGRLTSADPSTKGGLLAVQRFLKAAGVEPTSLRLVDGSGLSRMDLLAPMHLALALRAAWARDPSFADLMSGPGRPGTVEKRLLGTPAEGRVYAKSGTLTGHRNLVALVETLTGQWRVVVVMVGGVVVPRQVVDAAVDRVLLLVTSSS